MMKIQYTALAFCCALFAFAGCSSEAKEGSKPYPEGSTPVELSGSGTRAIGDNNSPVNLIAIAGNDITNIYIPQMRINFPEGLDTLTTKPVSFNNGSPLYPIGDNEIRFYAFSGNLTSDSLMTLRAGQGEINDAILSNNGWKESQTESDPGNEGLGTPGSSQDPAHVLEFRHVMTQLNVKVIVDTTQSNHVDPEPKYVNFTMDGLAGMGTYPINAKAPVIGNEQNAQVATQSGSSLTNVGLGVNYLVPTGMDLNGKTFRTLTIDNYTAELSDLRNTPITLGSGTNSRLLPGFSYDLTITIQKLKVVSVVLTLERWKANEIKDGLPGYTPYIVDLDLGSEYDTNGDGAITKLVLVTDNNKRYIGEGIEGEDQAGFVLLPQPGENVISAELYTSRGRLLSTPITNEYNSNALAIPLSAGGMLPANPLASYSRTNPYLITTPLQLYNIRKDLDGFYRQDVDIDLAGLVLLTGETIPSLGVFTGEYDGNGKWIANVNVKGSGLFTENQGLLQNIRIFSGSIDATSQTYAGSLCGINSGTIVGCFNEAMIHNVTGYAGGICGLNNSTAILLACLNTGDITSGNNIGGICGLNNNTFPGAIAACLNTGAMEGGPSNPGGICSVSLPTQDDVFRNCFWLVGTAQKVIGGPEYVVGSRNTGYLDCSDLDPEKMRNEVNITEGTEDKILNKLLVEINSNTTWQGKYKFLLDYAQTGITWPVPVKAN